jgi:hypothetical protein
MQGGIAAMAKSLQEALMEVQDDLKRIGLQVKNNSGRRRSRRKRRRKQSVSEPLSAQQAGK